MRFKIDENLPIEVAQLLAKAGHDAVTIHDQPMVSEPDLQVAAVCRTEQRAIVSLDLDFADIRTYPPCEFLGIIVLRPCSQAKPAVLSLVTRLVPLLTSETLSGRLWILDEGNLRIRPGEQNPDVDH